MAVAVQAPRKLQNDVWIFSFKALKVEIEIEKGNLAFKIAALAKMNFYMSALINLEWSEISNFLNKQIQNIIWEKGTSKSLENNRSTIVFHYHM